MKWDEYKILCERPDHFSRWAIELTTSLETGAETKCQLRRVLASAPVTKPSDHLGGPATDYLKVDLDIDAARDIVASLDARSKVLQSRDAGHSRHLRVVWCEYIDVMERRGRL